MADQFCGLFAAPSARLQSDLDERMSRTHEDVLLRLRHASVHADPQQSRCIHRHKPESGRPSTEENYSAVSQEVLRIRDGGGPHSHREKNEAEKWGSNKMALHQLLNRGLTCFQQFWAVLLSGGL